MILNIFEINNISHNLLIVLTRLIVGLLSSQEMSSVSPSQDEINK
jgi:hypothetical protein